MTVLTATFAKDVRGARPCVAPAGRGAVPSVAMAPSRSVRIDPPFAPVGRPVSGRPDDPGDGRGGRPVAIAVGPVIPDRPPQALLQRGPRLPARQGADL